MAKTTTLRGKVIHKEFSPTLSNTDRILGYNATTGEVTYRASIDTSTFVTSALPSAQILVGNGSGVATAVAMTGVIAITNAGVTSIVDNSIVNADINSSAAIAYSKLNLTGGVVNSDVSGSAAIAYSKLNLIGAILNADINASAAIERTKIASGTAYRIVVNNSSGALAESSITASRAIVSDANGLPVAATTTAAQIGYLSTTTSDVQSQLDTQIAGHTTDSLIQSPTATEDGFAITWNDGSQQWELTDPVIQGIPVGGATGQFLGKNSGTDYDASWLDLVIADVSDINASADDLNILAGAYAAGVTPTHISYIEGLASNAQDQINLKLDRTLTENFLFIGNSSNVAIGLATGANGYVLTSVGGVPTWQSPGSGGTVTSIDASGGTTGLTFAGGPITTNGTLTLSGTLGLANGGTGSTLADPNADRIMFWDDSAGAVDWLTIGSGLSISTTTISALLASVKDEYTGYTGGSISTSVFDGTELTDGQSAKVIVEVLLTQTSGTAGSTAIGFKLSIVVRKASGTLTAVGASVQSDVFNDTGDAFSGSQTLSISGGAVVLSMNLTTAKTFKRTYSILKYIS